MLEGKLVPGNQEKLISKEVFLQVNDLNAKHTQGYRIVEENVEIPLKRFIICACCGKLMRGYIVKKKNIHYYKCCTAGCNNNKNAQSLNDRFSAILNYFNIGVTPTFLKLLKEQMTATYLEMTNESQNENDLLYQSLAEINKKLERLEERFVEEEINLEMFKKYGDKFRAEQRELEVQIYSSTKRVSNLDDCINLIVDFASKLRLKWLKGDYLLKQQIQSLVFPDGLLYDRKTDECRTKRINNVFLYIAYFQQVISNKKRGIPELNLDYASLSSWVAGAGLEPTTFGL
jgi:site-specific DNA recombinase